MHLKVIYMDIVTLHTPSGISQCKVTNLAIGLFYFLSEHQAAAAVYLPIHWWSPGNQEDRDLSKTAPQTAHWSQEGTGSWWVETIVVIIFTQQVKATPCTTRLIYKGTQVSQHVIIMFMKGLRKKNEGKTNSLWTGAKKKWGRHLWLVRFALGWTWYISNTLNPPMITSAVHVELVAWPLFSFSFRFVGEECSISDIWLQPVLGCCERKSVVVKLGAREPLLCVCVCKLCNSV